MNNKKEVTRHSEFETIAGRIARGYQGMDEEIVLSRLEAVDRFALENYNPEFNLGLEDFRKLCRSNEVHRLCREGKAEHLSSLLTERLDAPIDMNGERVFGDFIQNRRAGADSIVSGVDSALFLDRLSGWRWASMACLLMGFSGSEIARKLGIARTTFHREMTPIMARFREEVVA